MHPARVTIIVVLASAAQLVALLAGSARPADAGFPKMAQSVKQRGQVPWPRQTVRPMALVGEVDAFSGLCFEALSTGVHTDPQVTPENDMARAPLLY